MKIDYNYGMEESFGDIERLILGQCGCGIENVNVVCDLFAIHDKHGSEKTPKGLLIKSNIFGNIAITQEILNTKFGLNVYIKYIKTRSRYENINVPDYNFRIIVAAMITNLPTSYIVKLLQVTHQKGFASGKSSIQKKFIELMGIIDREDVKDMIDHGDCYED